MTQNQEKIERYFELWVEFAKRQVKDDLEASVRRLKLSIDDFFEENISDLELSDRIELSERIEGILCDPSLLCEILEITPQVDTELRPGSVPIPGYTLLRPIGSGGYGQVWCAMAPGGVEVALKFLPKSSLLEKFGSMKELEALHNIKNIRHINLISLSGIWEKVNPNYIVYQMALSNETLMDKLCVSEHPDGIGTSELLDYFRDIAMALDCLNHPGPEATHPAIMHGDVKPENIFITEECALLGDFGSARIISSSGEDEGGSYSPAFVAPERLIGKIHSNSDQYSLASSWYFLRTGRILLSEAPRATTNANSSDWRTSHSFEQLRDNPSYRNPDLSLLPPRERKVLARALSFCPEDRYASNMDFIKALSHKHRFFPWVIWITVLALILGIYTHFQQTQKVARKEQVQIQEAKEHREYVTASRGVAMQMAGQFLVVKGMSQVVAEVDQEWQTVCKKSEVEPTMRESYIKDFCAMVDSRLDYWQEVVEVPLAPPSEDTWAVLRKNGAKIEEIEAYYSQVDPLVKQMYIDYLFAMRDSAEKYGLNQDMNAMDFPDMKLASYLYGSYVDLAYCSYLELLTSMPTEVQKSCRKLLVEQNIVFYGNVALDLTEEEYKALCAKIMADAKDEAERIMRPVRELEKETEKEEIRVKKFEDRQKKIREKEKKIEGAGRELTGRKQKLDEIVKKIFEKNAFQDEDSPGLMWAKMLRIASLLRLRLASEGILPYDDIYAKFLQMWDDFIKRNAEDESMVAVGKVAKLYFQGVVEKKIPDVGRIVFLIENNANHPNLRPGDIVTAINGHPIRSEEDADTYWNQTEGAKNVLTRLRFDSDGDPVWEDYTAQRGTPRVAYAELRE